jgi:hypothetical protein
MINACKMLSSVETVLSKKLEWIFCVNKLYSVESNAEDSLFYGNDFKVFVDLLVMVMGHCSDRTDR